MRMYRTGLPEEKQQQRDEAFREAERENAALPEEEEKQKKPADKDREHSAAVEFLAVLVEICYNFPEIVAGS